MSETSQTDANQKKEGDKKKKVFDPGMKRIFGWGFAALAVLLVFTFVQRAGRIPFFTENFLSLVLLMVIVVQSYIYRRQWEAMQEGLIETRKMVAQNERSVKAAQDTVILTERALRIGSRAYFFVYEATLESGISSGQYPLPNVVFKNSGKTPAFKHRVRLEQDFFGGEALEKARKGIMPDMRPMSGKGLGIVGPGSYTHIRPERQRWKRPEDEELAIKGEIEFYVWGLICYSDIFGEEHSSKFSLFAKNPNTTNLSFGMFGNELEDEEAEGDEQEQTK